MKHTVYAWCLFVLGDTDRKSEHTESWSRHVGLDLHTLTIRRIILIIITIWNNWVWSSFYLRTISAWRVDLLIDSFISRCVVVAAGNDGAGCDFVWGSLWEPHWAHCASLVSCLLFELRRPPHIMCVWTFPLSGCFVRVCLHTHSVSCWAKARGCLTTAGRPTSCSPSSLCVFTGVICPRPQNRAWTDSCKPARTPR